jgi:hypothetical protein
MASDTDEDVPMARTETNAEEGVIGTKRGNGRARRRTRARRDEGRNRDWGWVP